MTTISTPPFNALFFSASFSFNLHQLFTQHDWTLSVARGIMQYYPAIWCLYSPIADIDRTCPDPGFDLHRERHTGAPLSWQ